MGRGRTHFFRELAALPWPVGLGAGALGYAAIAYGIPLVFGRHSGAMASAFTAGNHPFMPLAWVFLGLCVIASASSFLAARRRRRLLDTRTGLESIAALGWRDFERLVGEAFRRRGYTVEETGLGGADGGIDLILRRDGKRTLVQCKQWRREKVPVNVVREMYGLLTHHRADAVRIAALGGFTEDAAKFAEGKPIELIDGTALLGMIREVRASTDARTRLPSNFEDELGKDMASEHAAPHCPKCKVTMVRQRHSATGKSFWGCVSLPGCSGQDVLRCLD
ncbi:restriction endonuclease [Pseudoxanthomonas sp. PXM02]|uniref:restriction endonuclease n=1 Tax=Pseudoxanthomonas sp. PXM02 TaxID=2769294 RepID=UPI00177D9539|nr:restriction endonuclease [Pseudoxanthomonas sp. PXM02]MBD9480578.1 restriction endonuclease [Pseudoxanthomonas sp. PXM02]